MGTSPASSCWPWEFQAPGSVVRSGQGTCTASSQAFTPLAARPTHLLTLVDVADVTDRNPSHPGTPLLRPHLDNRQNPTRSGGEDDLVAFCARYGLPVPRINTRVHGFEVDAYFPVERVIVEL